MPHYTNAEWMDYIANNFGTVGEAERWRNQNNVFVDGLPAPTYTGPLSTGGSAGVQPELPPSNPGQSPVYSPLQTQGAAKVEEDDQASPGALGTLSGDFTAPTADEWRQQQQQQAQYQADVAAQNKAQFEAGQKLIQQNYGGPSSADRLWAISRALLSPRPYRGFAGTLHNLTNALGGISQQQHDAEQKRAEALLALQQSYQNAGMGERKFGLQSQLDMLKARMAAAKGNQPRYMAVPQGGSLVDVNAYSNLPVMTATQVSAAAANPANKGMKFRTTDGRVMEIP